MHKYLNMIQKIMPSIFSIMGFVFIANIIYIYSHANNLFDKYEIKINGNKHIKNSFIINEIPHDNNSSILNVNMIKIQKKIEGLEYVQTAQISYILPNSLIINIIERFPTVLINKHDESVFMDSHGILLSLNEKSIINYPVPVLSINNEKDDFNYYKNKIITTINHLLLNYPNFYATINEIKINSDIWEFQNDHKTKFYANNDNLINQLIILKKFENTIYPQKQFKDYSYIDLRIENKIIVKEKYRKG
tara:strand:+ start:395 stop:1138 length:744 start_codon:yes stop_codon:yes gene_type:complete